MEALTQSGPIPADGISSFHIYSAKGELEYTVIDLDRSGSADLGSYDRVTRTGKPI